MVIDINGINSIVNVGQSTAAVDPASTANLFQAELQQQSSTATGRLLVAQNAEGTAVADTEQGYIDLNDQTAGKPKYNNQAVYRSTVTDGETAEQAYQRILALLKNIEGAELRLEVVYKDGRYDQFRLDYHNPWFKLYAIETPLSSDLLNIDPDSMLPPVEQNVLQDVAYFEITGQRAYPSEIPADERAAVNDTDNTITAMLAGLEGDKADLFLQRLAKFMRFTPQKPLEKLFFSAEKLTLQNFDQVQIARSRDIMAPMSEVRDHYGQVLIEEKANGEKVPFLIEGRAILDFNGHDVSQEKVDGSSNHYLSLIRTDTIPELKAEPQQYSEQLMSGAQKLPLRDSDQLGSASTWAIAVANGTLRDDSGYMLIERKASGQAVPYLINDAGIFHFSGFDISNANVNASSSYYLAKMDITAGPFKTDHLDLHDGDFAGWQLKNQTFTGADMHGANLYQAELVETKLTYTNLNDANLAEANLSDANLVGATLFNTNLYNAKLSRNTLSGAVINATTYLGISHLGNLNHEKIKFEHGVDFSNQILPDANFSHVKMTAADFSNADLKRSDFSNAWLLNSADFSGANLEHAYMKGLRAMYAKFPEAKLFLANLEAASLDHAKFYKADLTNANLVQAGLVGADFRKADLTRADLRGADLTNADLRGANLTEANLTGANLKGANLTGADLTNVIVEHEALSEARIDSQTDAGSTDQQSPIKDSMSTAKAAPPKDDMLAQQQPGEETAPPKDDMLAQQQSGEEAAQLLNNQDRQKPNNGYTQIQIGVEQREKGPGLINQTTDIQVAVKQAGLINAPQVETGQLQRESEKPQNPVYAQLSSGVRGALPPAVYAALGLSNEAIQSGYAAYKALHPSVVQDEQGQLKISLADFLKYPAPMQDQLAVISARAKSDDTTVSTLNTQAELYRQQVATTDQLTQQIEQRTAEIRAQAAQPITVIAERITLDSKAPPAQMIQEQKNIVGAGNLTSVSGGSESAQTQSNMVTSNAVSAHYPGAKNVPPYVYAQDRSGQLALHVVLKQPGQGLVLQAVSKNLIPIKADAQLTTHSNGNWQGVPSLSFGEQQTLQTLFGIQINNGTVTGYSGEVNVPTPVIIPAPAMQGPAPAAPAGIPAVPVP